MDSTPISSNVPDVLFCTGTAKSMWISVKSDLLPSEPTPAVRTKTIVLEMPPTNRMCDILRTISVGDSQPSPLARPDLPYVFLANALVGCGVEQISRSPA